MEAELWSKRDPEVWWDEPLTSSLESSLKGGRIMIKGQKFSGKDNRWCLPVCSC